jgi:pimeloyl-ACP methyl ester carboxylesterase
MRFLFPPSLPSVPQLHTWGPSSADRSAHALAALLRAWGYRDGLLVAHSYGTFVGSVLIQQHPDLVAACVLLDPVCLLLVHPMLTFKFVYRRLQSQSWTSLKHDWTRFMFSREINISATMCRRFYWTTLMLFPDAWPRRGGVVVLAQNDFLVPVPIIARHVTEQLVPRGDVTLLHHPVHRHGQFIADPRWQEEIIRATHEVLAKSSGGRGSAELKTSPVLAAGGLGAETAARLVTPLGGSVHHSRLPSACALEVSPGGEEAGPPAGELDVAPPLLLEEPSAAATVYLYPAGPEPSSSGSPDAAPSQLHPLTQGRITTAARACGTRDNSTRSVGAGPGGGDLSVRQRRGTVEGDLMAAAVGGKVSFNGALSGSAGGSSGAAGDGALARSLPPG